LKNNSKSEKLRKKYLPIALAIYIATAYILLQPMQQISAQQIPANIGACRVSLTPPTDATDMNTVIIGSKVKTIHVEKEVFDCQSPTAYIVDVSIYTEILENLATYPNVASNKTFEAITCVKEANTGNVVGCQKSSIPSSTTTLPTLYSCKSNTVGFPIEMNTVVGSNKIVKTVEAQKEAFNCSQSLTSTIPAVKDITIFTEIFENQTQGILKKTADSATCIKDVPKAKVLACKASTIPL
jgi:hypothetical protein